MTDMAPKKKKKSSGMLPVLGLVLAILLGVVAVIVGPLVVEQLVKYDNNNNGNLERQFNDFDADYDPITVDYVVSGLLWLTMLALMMFVAAVFVGEDPEHEAVKTLGPSPANKKAVAKALRRDLREAKRRERERNK
ncbi:MAG: hypothetical protein JW966_10085 [Anaerolineae bacterium]|nr:hypothetical protein [Anaerolineae bacterium]